MEKLDVFNCADALIASFFTDDRGCAHCNREHTLKYLLNGDLEITDGARKVMLHAGQCAYMRRDNRMWLQKRVPPGGQYRSLVMKFSRTYLRGYMQGIEPTSLLQMAHRDNSSLIKLPDNRPDVMSLFSSLLPYFDCGTEPSVDILRAKLDEGMAAILRTDPNTM